MSTPLLSLNAFRIGCGLLAFLLAGEPVWAEGFRGPFAAALEGGGRSERRGEADAEEHIETDRDSFTPATTTVAPGRFMIETSYSFLDNRAGADGHSLPELLLRAGVTDWLELRLGWNFEAGGGSAVSGSEVGSDFAAAGATESSVLYGLKVAVTDQAGWQPRTAVIAHATTPTSGAETATQFVSAVVAGWTLPNRWNLDGSVRYVAASEEGDRFNQWAPSIVLKAPVGERWNVHAEYFGIFSDNRADNTNAQYVSPGVHYLVTQDCEVGVRVGWGLNDDALRFFSNVGLGWQF